MDTFIQVYYVYVLKFSVCFPQKMSVYLETTFSENNMTVQSSAISRSQSLVDINIDKLLVSYCASYIIIGTSVNDQQRFML